MPDGGFPETGGRAPASSALILQIDRPGNESALQFPAVIRNLAAGVVTLEVKNPWTVMKWDSLKGQGGCLRLLSPETNELTEIPGIVRWARYTILDQNHGRLGLTLKLTDPNPSVQKLLLSYITQTPGDIKGLWNRWEQTRQTQEPESFATKITFFAALALLLIGLTLQLASAQSLKIFGWVLWFCGTLVVAVQTLRLWKSRRASR
jgi:hypothetical protein